ncbi:MAG TPA: hypothetical protein DHU96_14740 [Actinobacteria bacterium]|nr:hypothetical protein [Actinomycetota bacterium]
MTFIRAQSMSSRRAWKSSLNLLELAAHLRNDPADADRGDAGCCLADLVHGHRDTENGCLERQRQVVLEHDSEPRQLLVLVVAVDCSLVDQRVQIRFAQLAHWCKRSGELQRTETAWKGQAGL